MPVTVHLQALRALSAGVLCAASLSAARRSSCSSAAFLAAAAAAARLASAFTYVCVEVGLVRRGGTCEYFGDSAAHVQAQGTRARHEGLARYSS